MTESTHQHPSVARVLALLLVILCAGAVVFTISGTPAAALSANVSEPYPQTPGSTSNMTIATTAERGDAITQNGIKRVRVNLSGPTFDGNVRGISGSDVHMFVIQASGENSEEITATSARNDSSSATITATFDQALSVAPGERIIVRVDGVGLPSGPGRHPLRVAFTTPNGKTDGPISNPYRLVPARLNFSDQLVEENGQQTVRITAVNPDLGYIGIYKTNPQGNPQNRVGLVTASPSYHQESYAVNVSIEKGQQLTAVLYYETSGSSISEREAANFSREEDARTLNNGQSVTASAFVDIDRPAKRIDAGKKYTAGDTLLFTRGEADTRYILSSVEDGRALNEIRDFRTNSSGIATLQTSNLSTGKYAIITPTGRDVVSLDGDGVTNAADDSVFVNNPEQNKQIDQEQLNESNGSNQQEEGTSGGGVSLSLLFFLAVLFFAGVGVTAYFIQLRRMDI